MKEGYFSDENQTMKNIIAKLNALDIKFSETQKRRYALIDRAKEGDVESANILKKEHDLKVYTKTEIAEINKKNICNFAQKVLL